VAKDEEAPGNLGRHDERLGHELDGTWEDGEALACLWTTSGGRLGVPARCDEDASHPPGGACACEPRSISLGLNVTNGRGDAMSRVDVSDRKPPKIELPEGLRSMTDDVAKAGSDIRRAMPDIRGAIEGLRPHDLPKVEIDFPDRLELPRVEIRRHRSGPPWLAIGVVAGLLAATWVLMTSSTTGPRIRSWVDDLRLRFDRWRSGLQQGAEHPFDDADRATDRPTSLGERTAPDEAAPLSA
jgi:hypothetical protein